MFSEILMSGLKQSDQPSQQSDNMVITHLDEVLSLTLETISNLFTWIPLDGYKIGSANEHMIEKVVPFQKHFVEVICQYAHLDTCPHFVRCNEKLAKLLIMIR